MTNEPTDSAEDDAFPYDMDTFRDWVNIIRQQIKQMKEQVSNAYATAQAANMLVNTNAEYISKLEREHEKAPTAPPLPDSNGLWRDKDGDIWAYDGNENNPPILLFVTPFFDVCDLSADIPESWLSLHDYSPFTKIDNPFPAGEDHAN